MKHSNMHIAIAATLLAFQSGAAMAAETNEFASNAQVADSELAQTRGTGTPTFLTVSQLTAELTGNSVNNAISGNNYIDANALAGMNGLSSIIQNSGNNVIVQASTTVNVTFVGGPSLSGSF